MTLGSSFLVVVSLLASGATGRAASCESLASLKLPDTTITLAAATPAGTFTPPYGAALENVPEFCRVTGRITPTGDSNIYFEVWLPTSGWNGKFLGVGNGGFAGTIGYSGLAGNLKRGYATAGTDTGHEAQGTDATWAFRHPEKVIDFGYRALHLTTADAKSLVKVFYGEPVQHSYFDSCSDGGREALMEAQRFPEDFNGILAGAPANNWSRLFTAFVWNERALLATPDSAIPPAKLPVIQRAVMAACDRLDGVADGLIENPRACRFDPSVLVCTGADAADCLSRAQVDALQKIYEGPRNPRTQEALFVGQPPGTEAVPGSWGLWITPANAAGAVQFMFGNSYYGAAVFEDPNWNFRMLDFDRDVRIGDTKAGPVLNATSPDLRSFRASGGKRST